MKLGVVQEEDSARMQGQSLCLGAGKKISSTDFYNIYVSWCEDNLEKPRASAGFLHYIKENQKRYGLIYDAKCIGNCRGFHNVCKAEFSPVIGKTPFD